VRFTFGRLAARCRPLVRISARTMTAMIVTAAMLITSLRPPLAPLVSAVS
jgi:hypothetical protein